MVDSIRPPVAPELPRNTIVVTEAKSPILAFILILIAGPLGFLYVSAVGGILLVVMYGIFFLVTFGFGAIILALFNIGLAFIGAAMASAQNRRSLSKLQTL